MALPVCRRRSSLYREWLSCCDFPGGRRVVQSTCVLHLVSSFDTCSYSVGIWVCPAGVPRTERHCVDPSILRFCPAPVSSRQPPPPALCSSPWEPWSPGACTVPLSLCVCGGGRRPPCCPPGAVGGRAPLGPPLNNTGRKTHSTSHRCQNQLSLEIYKVCLTFLLPPRRDLRCT